MAEARDEWCFDFHVHGTGLVPERLVDELLCLEVIGWAEARHLGVGGGFRPASPRQGDAARSWHFRLGLCATVERQLIPASQAAELEKLLRAWCSDRGLGFAGGFRAYTAEEGA